MTKYDQTIAAWNKVAEENNIAAIHPAGKDGTDAFFESGAYDAERLVRHCNILGITLRSKVILDYGCGPGRVLIHLPPFFRQVWGYDSALQPIKKTDDFTFFCKGDAFFDCAKEFADIAYSISVFIHHTYADGWRMMKEVVDMVKPGGYLLLQIPIYDYSKEPSSWTDVAVWTPHMFENAALNAGCEVIETKANPGKFSFNNIGPNHHEFQILKKLNNEPIH